MRESPGSPPPPSATPPARLGTLVARGSLWLLANAMLARGASFLAQLALGALLAKSEFGLYAVAISISSFATVLKDGGVRQVLVQKRDEYSLLIGPVFWLAMTTNALIGVGIAALAPLSATLYGHAEIATLLYVIAISQPLSTPGAVLVTRLQIDMRFRESSIIATASALVRYGGCVILAYGGFGALSFVLPLPVLALVEWGLGWFYVRESQWGSRFRVKDWLPLVKEAQWILLGNIGVAGMNLGVSMIIGLLVPMTVVGVYYFAMQIVVQVGMVIAANLFQVLLPAFSAIARDSERLTDAARRSLAQIGLIAGPVCLGLAATFAPLEELAWGGKWADATHVVEVLGAFYPGTVVTAVAMAAMQARGRFRASGFSLVLVAVCTLLGAALGAATHGTALAIAFCSGLAAMLAALAITTLGLRDLGFGMYGVMRAVAPPWLAAIVAAVPAVLLDQHMRHLGLVGLRSYALLRTGLAGTAFCAVFAVFGWVFFKDSIRDALTTLRRRESKGA